MACTVTLSNISTNCDSQMGGIDVVYAINYADVEAVTLTTGVISAITLATGKTFNTYEFRKQSGSLTCTYNVDDVAGVKYVAGELALRFAKMETEKRISFMALCNGELALIAKDCNGKYWYLGYNRPVTMTAATGETGTNYTDANQYTITLSSMDNEMPYEVSSTVIPSILPTVQAASED